MNELQIQGALYNHFNAWLVAPNMTLELGEADLIRVTKAGFLTEYEIKCSRRDFLADKEKRNKHFVLSGMLEKTKALKNKTFKTRAGSIPAQFYYVSPPGVIEVEDLPNYAGLYHVGPKWYKVKCVKRAPRLHNEPLPDKVFQRFSVSLAHRLMQAKIKNAGT